MNAVFFLGSGRSPDPLLDPLEVCYASNVSPSGPQGPFGPEVPQACGSDPSQESAYADARRLADVR